MAIGPDEWDHRKIVKLWTGQKATFREGGRDLAQSSESSQFFGEDLSKDSQGTPVLGAEIPSHFSRRIGVKQSGKMRLRRAVGWFSNCFH
jgi:hypothetical protein